jgi:hypothetical protein
MRLASYLFSPHTPNRLAEIAQPQPTPEQSEPSEYEYFFSHVPRQHYFEFFSSSSCVLKQIDLFRRRERPLSFRETNVFERSHISVFFNLSLIVGREPAACAALSALWCWRRCSHQLSLPVKRISTEKLLSQLLVMIPSVLEEGCLD